jgi:hypothetical protein
MDIKIGLLVQNRLSVQDVVNHKKTMTIGHGTTLRKIREKGRGAEQEACPVS